MKMLSSVVDGIGGGGYDCFPALAAAGIERAAGEGPGEQPGRERERGEVGSAARWMDGWMEQRAAGEECTQLVLRLFRAEVDLGTERELHSNQVTQGNGTHSMLDTY